LPVDHDWRRVAFRKTFIDPIVVANTKGNQQVHPGVVWIRSVPAEGVEVCLRSWCDREAIHPAETIGYLVIEPGEYVLPNGGLLEPGSVELEGTDLHV
jgi:hypothetical protein